jgi:hypothetical protein
MTWWSEYSTPPTNQPLVTPLAIVAKPNNSIKRSAIIEKTVQDNNITKLESYEFGMYTYYYDFKNKQMYRLNSQQYINGKPNNTVEFEPCQNLGVMEYNNLNS